MYMRNWFLVPEYYVAPQKMCHTTLHAGFLRKTQNTKHMYVCMYVFLRPPKSALAHNRVTLVVCSTPLNPPTPHSPISIATKRHRHQHQALRLIRDWHKLERIELFNTRHSALGTFTQLDNQVSNSHLPVCVLPTAGTRRAWTATSSGARSITTIIPMRLTS